MAGLLRMINPMPGEERRSEPQPVAVLTARQFGLALQGWAHAIGFHGSDRVAARESAINYGSGAGLSAEQIDRVGLVFRWGMVEQIVAAEQES